jgi:hypothetical protein
MKVGAEIRMVRPERVELPTFWFVAIEAGNPNSFVCVAYGYCRSTPRSLIVRKLSVVILDQQIALPQQLPNDPNATGRCNEARRTKASAESRH